ncbi:zinc ABC transporter substrate-binding protein [Nocardioides sp. zg-1308]|uniref:Metal ABC transporter substrate-binding protein n=1 Tax=Nocardioides renjunii TaxID=3095075 RepID=A0ABU5KD66_9ACTN|nr:MULTISPECIES: metal ABC transporter substrate-binding protein [unclassified Nocardioides]MDZ5662394.1 metal ABC transporter substrate-binding protein [Nocardioides sp. S-58]NPD05933.1 zinc ABC transporter substrate-binding protein [Nocardioides sp. zg-1308]WQQ23805.1 metal ABC transporter substrate-binding protein [Nocardioides sp. S-34]
MSLTTRSLSLTSLLAATVLLAGCGQSDDAQAGSGRQAVASFYPLAWVTERVAGDGWSVENLTQPGQEPHDLDLDIAQTAALESADLVVLEKGFQPAVDAAAENTDAPVVDAAAVVDLLPASEDEHAHEEGEEGHEGETEEEHAEHEESTEGEDHDHGDSDPHFWLDPVRVADFADAVADELAEVDPDAAQTYADNAAELRTELEQLDQDFTDGLASCERTTTVVSHQAFAYLERYGLDFEPIAGLSPDAEPTAADLGHLQEVIEADGVTTVFSERLVSPKMAETLADDLGVTTAVLDPIEGLSDDTAEEDYLSLMRANLTALQQANGCS